MPGSSRHDPYRNFNFRVEIDGIASSSFSEVVFPDSTIGVVEYREGGDKTSSSRKLPGRVHYSNVVLRRGVSQSSDLWNWWNTVRNGTPDRRNGVIVLLDTDLTEVRRWSFTRRVAVPLRRLTARRPRRGDRDRDARARRRVVLARDLG